jgi:hypothetical protein
MKEHKNKGIGTQPGKAVPPDTGKMPHEARVPSFPDYNKDINTIFLSTRTSCCTSYPTSNKNDGIVNKIGATGFPACAKQTGSRLRYPIKRT